MIGIILAIAVWAYFEFYRIPKVLKGTLTEIEIEDVWHKHELEFQKKFDFEMSRFWKGTKEAVDEIWEKIDEFEQKRDVGTKISPKAISRN